MVRTDFAVKIVQVNESHPKPFKVTNRTFLFKQCARQNFRVGQAFLLFYWNRRKEFIKSNSSIINFHSIFQHLVETATTQFLINRCLYSN